MLFSQPEISISASGTLVKLSGESAFALMSLLGANIMPHNFYLHSSIVQVSLSDFWSSALYVIGFFVIASCALQFIYVFSIIRHPYIEIALELALLY